MRTIDSDFNLVIVLGFINCQTNDHSHPLVEILWIESYHLTEVRNNDFSRNLHFSTDKLQGIGHYPFKNRAKSAMIEQCSY